jgi:hypothetical protein
MGEDPTTQELRVKQIQREDAAREQANRLPEEQETAQFDRRADKAAYLRRKLEERAEAERKKGAERETSDE